MKVVMKVLKYQLFKQPSHTALNVFSGFRVIVILSHKGTFILALHRVWGYVVLTVIQV